MVTYEPVLYFAFYKCGPDIRFGFGQSAFNLSPCFAVIALLIRSSMAEIHMTWNWMTLGAL